MGSRFSHLHMLFQHPAPVERERTRAEREKASRRIREDMQEGRRLAAKQAAQQAVENDPEAAYRRHCRAQALLIANAGQARRGQPLLKRLVDDGETNDGNDTVEESSEDEDVERKNKAIALQIINAGRARRNLPLLTRLEQDR